MLTGITGFIALGYLAGLVVGAATIADMAALPRGAWRSTGRRRRNSEYLVVASWFILGWGAVLAGIIWFAGNARTQVRISHFDHSDSDRDDLDQSDFDEDEFDQDDFLEGDWVESKTLEARKPPREVAFAHTSAEPLEPKVRTQIDLVGEARMATPRVEGDVELDLEEVSEIDITEVHTAE